MGFNHLKQIVHGYTNIIQYYNTSREISTEYK